MRKSAHLTIEQITTFDVIPWEDNPRRNAKAIEAVAASIEEFGFNQPILIDQNNRIAAGHTRWEAAKLLNMPSIPCVRREMTEAEFIAYNIADNKTGEIAGWDKKQLAECMHVLDELDALVIPGFSDNEIDKLFGLNNTTESSSAQSGDFGEGNQVSEEKDADDDSRVKHLKLTFSPKEYRKVNSKLKAIMKEGDLDTLADAFIKALEGFQEQQKVIKKKGPVLVTK